MAGDWINENLEGEAKVAICDYSLINFLKVRADYIEIGLLERVPNAEIVARQDAGLLDQGVDFGERLLQAYPDVDVVAGINDNGVLGVKEAFEVAHKTSSQIAMFACDATDEGLKAIKSDSVFRGTIDSKLVQMGEDMFMTAVNTYLGKPSSERVVTFDIVPITKENIGSVEKKDF
jgi:ribose transport system substrate-binding protein